MTVLGRIITLWALWWRFWFNCRGFGECHIDTWWDICVAVGGGF